uniref:(northern house mosquito) hypothetical protein n=1 Tax=Culex pipiens TaxID=7175 RepID=A0A8D8ABD6_CULPI
MPDQGRKGPTQVRQAAAAPVRAAGRKEPHRRVGVRRRGAGVDGQQRHHAVHHEPAGRALERELQLILFSAGWFWEKGFSVGGPLRQRNVEGGERVSVCARLRE